LTTVFFHNGDAAYPIFQEENQMKQQRMFASDSTRKDDNARRFATGIGLLLLGLFLTLAVVYTATYGQGLPADRVGATQGGASQNRFSVTVDTGEAVNVYLPLILRDFPFTPAAPVLNAISNEDGDGNYTVSWSASEGADTYTLQEATDANFTNATAVYAGPTTLKAISGRDLGTYYYRVRAVNAYASSGWSNVQSVVVTVEPQPGGWVKVTIPGQTNQGAFNSIALDSQDNPHISFMDATHKAVKYTYWNGSDWNTETIDTMSSLLLHNSSLALNMSDHAQIAYPSGSSMFLHHAQWNGTQWQLTAVNNNEPTVWYANLALKTNGEPCISYRKDAVSYYIRYVCRVDGNWPVYTTVATLYGGSTIDTFYHALAIDTQDRAHISYVSAAPWGLYYATRSATGSWVRTAVDTTDTVGFYSSLALDSQDRPHISYYDKTNGDLKYVRWTGSQWIIERIDSPGDVGKHTSLALDTGDNPHISYYDATNCHLKYAFWDGNHWQIETLDSQGNVGEWTSLALDNAGNVHISYYDRSNGKLKYATNSGALGQQSQR
jgi:hypothetical protein